MLRVVSASRRSYIDILWCSLLDREPLGACSLYIVATNYLAKDLIIIAEVLPHIGVYRSWLLWCRWPPNTLVIALDQEVIVAHAYSRRSITKISNWYKNKWQSPLKEGILFIRRYRSVYQQQQFQLQTQIRSKESSVLCQKARSLSTTLLLSCPITNIATRILCYTNVYSRTSPTGKFHV